MQQAEECVKWSNEHKNKIPSRISKDPIEKKLGQKLTDWRQALKGKGHTKCYDEVKEHLDANLPGWRV